MHLTGRLVYSRGGNDIQMLDFGTMERETVYEGAYVGIGINHLTKLTENTFVFEDCHGTRDPNCLLKEFDMDHRSVNTLRSGRMPSYLAGSNSLFFYDSLGDKGEQWLFVAGKDTVDTASQVAKAPPEHVSSMGMTYSRMAPAVQISPDEVAFLGDEEEIWTYKISQARLASTEIEHCKPIAWRKETQHLFCWDWESKYFSQVDLKTKRAEKLSQLGDAYSLVYLPKHDALIYGKGRLRFFISETSDIFAYSFGNGKTVRLLKDAYITSGVRFD